MTKLDLFSIQELPQKVSVNNGSEYFSYADAHAIHDALTAFREQLPRE